MPSGVTFTDKSIESLFTNCYYNLMRSLTEIDMIIRLLLSFAAGTIIGAERSSRRQVAGLRTHILIALGSTCLMLLSVWLPRQFNPSGGGDAGRIAAQVVSGIGFLGAGAIIRLGNNVKGLTTAASLWLTAAIGLVVGAGMYIVAAVTEALALVALTVMDRVEKKIFPEAQNKFLEVHYKHNLAPNTEFTQEILKNNGVKIQTINVIQGGLGKNKRTRVSYLVSIPYSVDISNLAKLFKESEDIDRIELKEKF
jgi:putative Mg2+ transporter-C (MgtC) family protein